jgi:hypothetical protein
MKNWLRVESNHHFQTDWCPANYQYLMQHLVLYLSALNYTQNMQVDLTMGFP